MRVVVLAALAACQQAVDLDAEGRAPEIEIGVVSNPINRSLVSLTWDGTVCPGATAVVSLEPEDKYMASEAPGDGLVRLLGLPPDTEYAFVVDLDVDGVACATGAGEFVTGPPVGSAPSVSLVVDDGTTEGWLMTSMAIRPAAAVMLDDSGAVVWYWPESDADSVSRAILSRDRGTVIYGAYTLVPHTAEAAVNDIVRVSIDGEQVERIPTRQMHHDLLERSNGVIAYLDRSHVDVEGNGRLWAADLLVELNPDGSDRVVWDAWDAIPWDVANFPDDPGAVGQREWTHANAIQYSEAEDAYYISLRFRNSIVKVDAETGEMLQVFGGKHSTVALLQGDWPSGQHQFRVLGDRLLVFDNSALNVLSSRIVEFEIDETTGSARQVWDHHHDPPDYAFVLGDVELLDNGNLMVVWSTSGQIDVVTPAGDLVWRLNTPVGRVLGYAQWFKDDGPGDF